MLFLCNYLNIIFFNSSVFKNARDYKLFKILINLHKLQILKTVSLVCPDDGDLATPVPDSQGTSACFFAFYLKAADHSPVTQG